MTVSELFKTENIDLDLLKEMFLDESSYWNGALTFLSDKWNSDIESLSAKQGAWLTRILEDAVERKIEKKS